MAENISNITPIPEDPYQTADELREALLSGYVPGKEVKLSDLDAMDDVAPVLPNDIDFQSPTSPGDDDSDDAKVASFIEMFGAEGDSPLKAHDWVVWVPSDLDLASFSGNLFGHVRPETESIYVLSFGQDEGNVKNAIQVGFVTDSPRIYNDPKVLPGDTWQLTVLNDGNEVQDMRVACVPETGAERYDNVQPCRIKEYDRVTNLFSRNTGILESGEMLNKTAVLIGVGSVGSFVAMQLARSGVGKFVLCDTDTLEIHNICRHQCGFEDIGRYKVDAVKDKILNINPDAEVATFKLPIERVPESELMPHLGRDTIIIGGGDNRASANEGCKLACRTDSSFVATSCWTRAFAGEIFYWQSGHGLACYECALGGLIDDERPASHANYFGMEEEVNTLSFEPGIACDIDFVTLIACKLALDLLNRDNPNYTPRVIDYLKQYTWACNTNKTNIGGERAGIFSYPLQVTNSLKVGKRDDCPFCGNVEKDD